MNRTVKFLCCFPEHLSYIKSARSLQLLQLSKKRFYATKHSSAANLWEEYTQLKHFVEAQPLPRDQKASSVFANNELDLQAIEVYGFDYDYTLACYTKELHHLIYDEGKKILIQNLKYPKEIGELNFNPNYAVRGLHCDIEKGLLLKIDAFHNIQLGTVYKGLTAVPDEEVKALYNGTHVSIEEMSNFYGTVSQGAIMTQLMDLFALPEMTLFANVIEYLVNRRIPYSPEYVFYDVKSAVQGLHSTGKLHRLIMEDLDRFIGQKGGVSDLLQGLESAGKKLFLITNSSFHFVDKGMRYMIGPQWTDLFDVIIANARKPKFFNESYRPAGKYRPTNKQRPFRKFDRTTDQKSWSPVTSLKKGEIYKEGNFYDLRELTGWYGGKVLYFGDHVYTDLADATLKHGWRTGAIIPELVDEIQGINSSTFKESVRWKLALEGLIQRTQMYECPEANQVMHEWTEERNKLRMTTKDIFNPQFGSIFRTYSNPTYFTRRLNRFADIYTSSVMNLLNYPVQHTFYPRRSALPHELGFSEYVPTNGYPDLS